MEKQQLESIISKIESVQESVIVLQQNEWNQENVQLYCEQRGIHYDEKTFVRSQNAISMIKGYSSSELFEKLYNTKQNVSSLLDRYYEWRSYNAQYLKYIDNHINDVLQHIESLIGAFKPCNPSDFSNFLSNIYSELHSLESKLNPNLDELFGNFKYGNKNYAVFGKNGSGKTTLLNKIALDIFEGSAIVAPADRNVTFDEKGPFVYVNSKASDLNGALSDNNALQYLIRKFRDILVDEHRNEISYENSVEIKLKNILSDLDLERKVEIKDEINGFLCPMNGAEKYSLSNGSDGERAVIYLILATLCLPENSFFFIDEPENHLNGLLMQNLFNSLENIRQDVTFVYFTHNINFIESRGAVELIYLEKSERYLEWTFKKLQTFGDIDLDIVLNIEGSQKNVIFCEGDNQNSIDYKVISIIYPDYTVIPVGSCEKVIENTKGLNGNHSIFRRKAYGIVDNDFRTDSEVDSLKRRNICVLAYNEWESLLLSKAVITAINGDILNLNIDDVIIYLVDSLRGKKEGIINDFLNKRYLRIVSSEKLRYDENFNRTIDDLNRKNASAIIEEVESLSARLDLYFEKYEYDNILKVVPGKMLLGEATHKLGLHMKEGYISKFLSLLESSAEFKTLIKSSILIEEC